MKFLGIDDEATLLALSQAQEADEDEFVCAMNTFGVYYHWTGDPASPHQMFSIWHGEDAPDSIEQYREDFQNFFLAVGLKSIQPELKAF